MLVAQTTRPLSSLSLLFFFSFSPLFQNLYFSCLHTRINNAEGDDFFLRSCQVYDCFFTKGLTQRSYFEVLLTADSQCFTHDDARTFVPTIPRRRLGERSL